MTSSGVYTQRNVRETTLSATNYRYNNQSWQSAIISTWHSLPWIICVISAVDSAAVDSALDSLADGLSAVNLSVDLVLDSVAVDAVDLAAVNYSLAVDGCWFVGAVQRAAIDRTIPVPVCYDCLVFLSEEVDCCVSFLIHLFGAANNIIVHEPRLMVIRRWPANGTLLELRTGRRSIINSLSQTFGILQRW